MAPPRLDLSNEDLLRSHVHAIWLAETGLALDRSVGRILHHAARAAHRAVGADVGFP